MLNFPRNPFHREHAWAKVDDSTFNKGHFQRRLVRNYETLLMLCRLQGKQLCLFSLTWSRAHYDKQRTQIKLINEACLQVEHICFSAFVLIRVTLWERKWSRRAAGICSDGTENECHISFCRGKITLTTLLPERGPREIVNLVPLITKASVSGTKFFLMTPGSQREKVKGRSHKRAAAK